jgi:pimeloyl-ACP methyl ester carboxylesterase
LGAKAVLRNGIKWFVKKILFYPMLTLAALFGLMALFPEDTARLAVNLERSASGLDHKTVVVAGETWHYLEGGPEDAEVLLLIHGFGGDKDNWTRFARSLTESYRVIAPDLPGFGESAWHVDWDYSLFPQRERLHGFARALDLNQFHVAGNSMGGHLAALYTHRYSQDVISLSLVDNAGVAAPVETDHERAITKGKNPLIVETVDDFDVLLSFVTHKKPFAPWPVKGVFARRAVDHAESNHAIFDSYIADRSAGLELILGDIRRPVLIIWGELDRILDVSLVAVMRPLLPQAEVIIMQDTGHMPMLERPAETAAHYLSFLQELQP